MRILIVEDEPIIAFDLSEQLRSLGFDVVGVAATVAAALDLYNRCSCDAAVLDVNLDRETSAPVAARLLSDNVPFVTVTGYGRSQLPAEFQEAPLVGKPVQVERLKQELLRSARGVA